MVPLAVSGTAIIGVAVAGSIALLITLLRREDRFEAMESSEKEPPEDEAAAEE
jgi:hypothetical protein